MSSKVTSSIDDSAKLAQRLYETSLSPVRSSITSPLEAQHAYGAYIDFVCRATIAQPPKRLLDVGCGNGWSTFLFAQRGFEAVGIDVHRLNYRIPKLTALSYQTASALSLPFDAAAFDIIACYQTLEHVPDPARALDEMIRVCKPGGTICIVGPNLVSVTNSLKAVLIWVWRARPMRRIVFRYSDTPRHPVGNTVFESLGQLAVTTWRLATKLIDRRHEFTMRVPDVVPPFAADNDACYLCNPVDLMRYFARQGLVVIRVGAWGRPAWTAPLAGGTWIAARKALEPIEGAQVSKPVTAVTVF